MDRIRSLMLALAVALLGVGPAAADTLLINSIEPAPAMQTPAAGASMAAVRQRYGDPVAEQPTVSTSGGPMQPPITRWDYAGFTVIFEHDRVVHSVVHRSSDN